MKVRLSALAVLFFASSGGSLSLAAQHTIRVSVDSNGFEGNHGSDGARISADGRFVAFTSAATNLVSGDTNGYGDVFVHDCQAGTTTRVSVDTSGIESNGPSFVGSISADGCFVAFHSYATNLVLNDTNAAADVFVHDRQTGRTEQVSVDSAGIGGNDSCSYGRISADGRFVAFTGFATNLVAGDTNGVGDVFLHDRQTGITTRVSVDSSGIQGNGYSFNSPISADGCFVAFTSDATNLVAGDSNAEPDVFVHDRQTGTTTRVSIDSAGRQGSGWCCDEASVSADGRFVAFTSDAPNLVPGDTNATRDVFVHDRQTGATTRVSIDSNGAEGNSGGDLPSISADGRLVALKSWSDNLVPGDTNGQSDVFVHDRQTGITTRVSVSSNGVEGNQNSDQPSMSADGSVVAFDTLSNNLVPGDTNHSPDVFVRIECLVDATWANYGEGFPGSSGVPSLTSRDDPVIGSTVTLDLGNSYGNDTPGILLAGYTDAQLPTSWGGELLVIPAVVHPIFVRWSGSTLIAELPDEPHLCGVELFTQVLEVDPGAAKGVSFTEGLKLVLGY